MEPLGVDANQFCYPFLLDPGVTKTLLLKCVKSTGRKAVAGGRVKVAVW